MTRIALAALFVGLLLAPAGAAGRSYVGRKLPRNRFVDTQGHEIDPADYEGSVFVVYGGIPW